MLLVVAYDVADDRRRARLHTLLLGWGTPVQESVFECEVDERGAREVKRRVRRMVRPAEDNVRFYALCSACAVRAEDAAGTSRPAEPAVWGV